MYGELYDFLAYSVLSDECLKTFLCSKILISVLVLHQSSRLRGSLDFAEVFVESYNGRYLDIVGYNVRIWYVGTYVDGLCHGDLNILIIEHNQTPQTHDIATWVSYLSI